MFADHKTECNALPDYSVPAAAKLSGNVASSLAQGVLATAASLAAAALTFRQ